MTLSEITEKHIELQFFPGYTERDKAIFSEFTSSPAEPEKGFVVDFLGSRLRVTSLWKEARSLDGCVLGLPIPADFHAEAIEWIGLLEAVRDAKKSYVAMELGAGFGPWVIAGGLAARKRGVEEIRLVAVEGDPQHFAFLRQHFVDNGFDPDRHTLLEAAVGSKPGFAQWPVSENSAEEWGGRPIQPKDEQTPSPSRATKAVTVVALRDLVLKEPRWDLIHIDVQGDEVDICRSCLDELNARVARMVIGTHSRKIEGEILDMMWRAKWVLDHEKPCKFSFSQQSTDLESMTTLDGTQVWRNPRLASDPYSRGGLGQKITSGTNQLRMSPGEVKSISIHAFNSGSRTWFKEQVTAPINAGYRWSGENGEVLPIEGERTFLDRDVLPGDRIDLNLRIVAPPSPGSYRLWISMVEEGVAWFYQLQCEPLVIDAEIS